MVRIGGGRRDVQREDIVREALRVGIGVGEVRGRVAQRHKVHVYAIATGSTGCVPPSAVSVSRSSLMSARVCGSSVR